MVHSGDPSLTGPWICNQVLSDGSNAACFETGGVVQVTEQRVTPPWVIPQLEEKKPELQPAQLELRFSLTF